MDTFSKRALTLGLSISLILCSASLLIYTVGHATAETPGVLLKPNKMMPMGGSGGFGIGVNANFLYYGFSAEDGTYIYKVDLTNPKIKAWE